MNLLGPLILIEEIYQKVDDGLNMKTIAMVVLAILATVFAQSSGFME
jgi:hypothetical protein